MCVCVCVSTPYTQTNSSSSSGSARRWYQVTTAHTHAHTHMRHASTHLCECLHASQELIPTKMPKTNAYTQAIKDIVCVCVCMCVCTQVIMSPEDALASHPEPTLMCGPTADGSCRPRIHHIQVGTHTMHPCEESTGFRQDRMLVMSYRSVLCRRVLQHRTCAAAW